MKVSSSFSPLLRIFVTFLVTCWPPCFVPHSTLKDAPVEMDRGSSQLASQVPGIKSWAFILRATNSKKSSKKQHFAPRSFHFPFRLRLQSCHPGEHAQYMNQTLERTTKLQPDSLAHLAAMLTTAEGDELQKAQRREVWKRLRKGVRKRWEVGLDLETFFV